MSAREDSRRPIVIWLVAVYLLILGMVVVGGVTRLTGSGLSMTEWRPLMGALPPMSAAEWTEVFDQYQQSPQYEQVNHWMTLSDFKRIFFWEYVHRVLGRLIGVAFFLPWLWFAIRRRLRGKLALQTLGVFVLGGAQGFMGWYMVKSGLVDRPAVSHLRLAAHLSLALLLGHWILWIVLGQRQRSDPEPSTRGRCAAIWGIIALLCVQIVWGAFMAGTRAGYLFSTFPDLNGALVPASLLGAESLTDAAMNDPSSIHFLHRTLGYLVTLVVIAYWLSMRRRVGGPQQRQAMDILAAATVVQVVLGVLTVIWGMPIWLAATHQAGAYLLLSAALVVAFRFRGTEAEAG